MIHCTDVDGWAAGEVDEATDAVAEQVHGPERPGQLLPFDRLKAKALVIMFQRRQAEEIKALGWMGLLMLVN